MKSELVAGSLRLELPELIHEGEGKLIEEKSVITNIVSTFNGTLIDWVTRCWQISLVFNDFFH